MKKNEHRPTERVLDILEVLSSNTEGLTLTEIATAIEAPKSSILPVVHTMCSRKFIFMDKNTSKYTIGISSYYIGKSYSSSKNVLEFIKSEMRYIVKKSGEICQLGILDGNKVLYIEKVDSDEPIRLISSIGKRLPAYCTSIGKSLLINKTLDELKELYPDGLKAFTQNTSCISIPLLKDSKAIASLSVSIPTFRFSDEKFELIKNILLEVRFKIETFFKENDIDADIFMFNDVE